MEEKEFTPQEPQWYVDLNREEFIGFRLLLARVNGPLRLRVPTLVMVLLCCVALVGMVLVFITLTIFEMLQKLLLRSRKGKQVYRITSRDVVSVLQLINRLADTYGFQVNNLQAEHGTNGDHSVQFLADFGRGNRKKRMCRFLEELAQQDCVLCVSTADEAAAIK